ncbi:MULTISPECIES: carboxylating nicotinate-nucleotide diphosphorylase [unclassified Methanoregula]|uniref:carboxylating nicotinate-nucleotide diphosphorylase n=1 Tax=unclassified Methanoregula TaxID=2649730 RepID=UPI0009D39D47|nr:MULTISPECIES: carboxylating nicotinate-nucleotide diphosphorylase [unclassified Methanoregula]OPX61639.1 MAG: nicotinate-nucleotide pyrophosphorylase [Methanoregula sp. PtaB.Bin085]OPY34052.1 MAG: nicotinate-nucleotide pyrophosphorylase [Methanoregula sp. PtaU1.Bin006]
MIPLEYLLRFIEEDTPYGDITSEAVIPDCCCRAVIRAEQNGIIAGIAEASALFSHFGIAVKQKKMDGDTVRSDDVVLSLSGNARAILLVERTALNIIGRMSGIATQTKKFSDIVASVNSRCRIAATRKTAPGLRALDKKAVQLGGGDPHRMSLSDGILIKDNHLALVPLSKAIQAAKAASAYRKIEVEVETPRDALTAAKTGADIILLDNMTPLLVKTTLANLKRAGLRDHVTIELSGGITETTLPEYATLDVDTISMGALTHTVRNFSITLEILPDDH